MDRVLGLAGVRNGAPDGNYVKAEPLALIDDKKNGRLFFDVGGKLVGVNLTYAQYFMSKVKGATFMVNPNDLDAALRVMDGSKLAGILMPIRQSIYNQEKLTVADIRGYMAASGKDKPQSVAKRLQKAAADQQAADDRDTFTLQRLNRETNQMEPVTFKRGEYITYKVGGKDQFGEIDGISQAKRQFSVDGLWYDMGFAYKAERPAAPNAGTAPLSSVIDKVNAKNGQGLTDADRVPGATDIGWDAMSQEQRTKILTAPSGWSTAKGGLNV